MSKKHVAVCDLCGREAPLGSMFEEMNVPAGWLMVAVAEANDGRAHLVDRTDFCSWPCVAAYAVRRVNAPDAH